MENNLAVSLRTKRGYVGVLKNGYSYNGSRVIRAQDREALKLKTDASEKNSEDAHWVTMNHSPVLIKGGYIVGGAGGKFNGALSTKYGAAAKQERPKAQKISSVSEIEGALKAAGFSRVDTESLKNADEKLLVENVNRLLELEARIGAVADLGICKFEVDSYPFRGRKTIAMVEWGYSLDSVSLQLNPRHYKSYEQCAKGKENDCKSGYNMPCTPENYPVYIMTHEYGHIIQLTLYREEFKKHGWTPENKDALINWDAKTTSGTFGRAKKISDNVNRRVYEEIQEIGKRKDPLFNLKNHISRYGAKNYSEAFAEMFANSQCGAPNAAGEAMNIWLKEKGFLRE